MTLNPGPLLRPIVLGGLIAGTIDIGAACLINWLKPIVILHAIASGVLGRASFHEGMRSAALGLALQWAMSILIAAIFVLATRWMDSLRRNWLGSSVAYGVVIFFVMNYAVVPLSAVGHAPHFTAPQLAGNMLAMLLIGLIIAFFARERSGA